MVMLPRAYCHEAIWSNHLYKARLRLTLLDYSVGRSDRTRNAPATPLMPWVATSCTRSEPQAKMRPPQLEPARWAQFRAPWLRRWMHTCRLHEARDYGDRHQYCPLGLTSFGMRSRPVRCSPRTAQVNSVDRPAPALSTAKEASEREGLVRGAHQTVRITALA